MIMACIPVRYSSSRLPGKHFFPLAGKPILQYLIERAMKIPSVKKVYLCVGQDGNESKYSKFAENSKLGLIWGPVDNVLQRYLTAIKDAETIFGENVEAMVRITGDDCFPDIDQIEKLIHFRKQFDLDMALFKFYIPGMDAEVYSASALKTIDLNGLGGNSEYLKDLAFHPCFKSDSIYCGYDPKIKLSLDRPEDYTFICRHAPALLKEKEYFGMEDVEKYFSKLKPKT